jgi:hypothetical protein
MIAGKFRVPFFFFDGQQKNLATHSNSVVLMGISCRTRDFRFKAEMEIGFKTRVFVQKASNKPL